MLTVPKQDEKFAAMSFNDWQAATAPKVRGTWNLHRAFQEQQSEPLEHFFMFSSTGALSGQEGQANYHAGNTFMESFVGYRHSLGLAASVVNIGALEDVGYASENPSVLDRVRLTSQYLIREAEILDCIGLAFKRSQPKTVNPIEYVGSYVQKSQIGSGVRSLLPLTAPGNRVSWRKDSRLLVYRNLQDGQSSAAAAAETGGTSSDNELHQFLKSGSANPSLLRDAASAALLARQIGYKLLSFMMRSPEELDLNAPMASMGIDSLIGIEVRNWIRRIVGVEFTMFEIMTAESVLVLGEAAQKKLMDKFQMRV